MLVITWYFLFLGGLVDANLLFYTLLPSNLGKYGL